jgi:hypothetical protein
MSRTRTRFSVALATGLGCLGPIAATAPAQGPGDEVRRAAAEWGRRGGPSRRVVDQVCIVPDVPTFLEAVSSWDRDHWFPVLIGDVELTFKFLRAFRPARIVRYPRRAEPLAADRVWDRALAAVGGSWAEADAPASEAMPGNAPPRGVGPSPPGVVVSSPDSPTLAGAVALAAGRFQPLIRWDPPRRFSDVIDVAEARMMALDLETQVGARVRNYGRLGDDCDFITLAGNWPYKYRDPQGEQALDDLVGRFVDNRGRWAFVGRLVGGASAAAYQAMCALFLQPRSAILFNTYDEAGEPWSSFAMRGASERLAALLPVEHRSGARAGLSGWHEAFDPVNRFGLVLINSHGGPSQFHVVDGTAATADVPPSVPSAVLMVHSFSAANPTDPQTIAGRWLAGGAFVYFGSMNEPFLQSFRTPDEVASRVAEGMPLGAAARKAAAEPFGHPWRLVYLGDPLYRLRPDDRPRLSSWGPVAAWPEFEAAADPGDAATDDARLAWIAEAALVRLRRDPGPSRRADLAAVLAAIDRQRLSPPLRPLRDALLIDMMPADLRAILAKIPPSERSDSVQRHWEGCLLADLQRLATARDLGGAMGLWDEAIRSPSPREFLDVVTARVSALADSPPRRASWDARLRDALRDLEGTPRAELIQAERKRLGDQAGAARGQP